MVEARFLSVRGRKVNANEILSMMDYNEASPPMPDWIVDWQRAQPAMSDIEYLDE